MTEGQVLDVAKEAIYTIIICSDSNVDHFTGCWFDCQYFPDGYIYSGADADVCS